MRKRLSSSRPGLGSITVKDIAKEAGVSVATVSRVLNGRDTVDVELRDRVQRVVDLLGYRPNRLARNLRTNSTNVIALVVPDIQNPFFVSVARGIEEVALRRGYTLLVCNTDDDPQRERNYFEVLRDEAVAGIVVCSADEQSSSAAVDQALSQGIAVVALDRRIEGVAVDTVLSDNFGGSRLAVSHLIGLGHRRIGIIAGPDRFAPGRERRLGYEQAFHDRGLSIDRSLIKVTDYSRQAANSSTDEILDLGQPPTALFLSSGPSALGALVAVNRRGLRIPDDISFVIFDDLDWTTAYNPPLTAVAQNTHDLGMTAAEALFRRIAGEQEPPRERRVLTQLHVRNSCLDLSAFPRQVQGVHADGESVSFEQALVVQNRGGIHPCGNQ